MLLAVAANMAAIKLAYHASSQEECDVLSFASKQHHVQTWIDSSASLAQVLSVRTHLVPV